MVQDDDIAAKKTDSQPADGSEVSISILTVTYNAAETIDRTLKSVESQVGGDFEHVIMDGGSTDDTVSMAEAYRMRNPHIRIVVVSEPDKGLYDAMNKTLLRARGRYVCFLNAGDSLHASDTLYTITSRMAGYSPLPGVIYGETDIVDADGLFLRHRDKKCPDHLSWRSFKHGMVVCHQSFYALRSICGSYDLTYRFSADFDWCVRVMKQAEEQGLPLVNSHLILTDYLAEGMTTRNHKASLKERFRIMRKHYGWLTTVAMHGWFALKRVLG